MEPNLSNFHIMMQCLKKKKIQTLSVIGKIFNKKKNTEHLIKQNRDAQNQKEI